MSQTLVSSVPGIFDAFVSLVTAEGAAQTPQVPVFDTTLNQDEPPSYVLVTGIENYRITWENIGVFSQKERYDLKGYASIFSGDATPDDATVVSDIRTQVYEMFQTVVMAPVMSNRDMPLLGTTGPSPHLMLPADISYTAGPGSMGGAQAGWAGVINFSFHFEAVITPA